MCHKHYNQNFLHVQFDQWESDKVEGPAQNKCLQPDPRHCGRSPTTLTLDYMPVLELGGALFARKFDATYDAKILDAIDANRRLQDTVGYSEKPRQYFENIRFVRSAENGVELCVSMASQAERSIYEVSLKPCDRRDASQRFNIGPCSTDGHIELRSGRQALVKPGDHSPSREHWHAAKPAKEGEPPERRSYFADGPPKLTKRQAELYGLVAYDGYAGNTVEDLAQ